MDDVTIGDRLRTLPEAVEPDPDFEARLRQRLAAELAAPERRDGIRLVPSDADDADTRATRTWLAWSVAAAAVTALALALVATVRSGDDLAPAEPIDSLPVTPPSAPGPAPTTTSPPTTTPASTVPPTPMVDTVAIESGDNAYRVAAGDEHLWVMSLRGDLSRIDAVTLEVTGTLRLSDSGEIVAGPDALWFADARNGQILRIDPGSLEIVERIDTGIALVPDVYRPVGVAMYAGARRTFAAIGGLAVDGGSVFVGDHAGVVIEFDATTGEEVDRLLVGVRPDIVRVADDHLLVAAFRDDVVEVYARTDGSLLYRVDGLGQLTGAALGPDAAFAHDLSTGDVIRIDLATGEQVRNEQLAPPAVFQGLPVHSAGPTVSADALFVDVEVGIVLLDPVTLELLETLDVPGRGGDATVTPDGAAWIARYTDRSVTRVVPAAP